MKDFHLVKQIYLDIQSQFRLLLSVSSSSDHLLIWKAQQRFIIKKNSEMQVLLPLKSHLEQSTSELNLWVVTQGGCSFSYGKGRL